MPSVHEIITEKIIKKLESDVAPWRKPWTCQTPANVGMCWPCKPANDPFAFDHALVIVASHPRNALIAISSSTFFGAGTTVQLGAIVRLLLP
jgi:antirestriction protein ArdC